MYTTWEYAHESYLLKIQNERRRLLYSCYHWYLHRHFTRMLPACCIASIVGFHDGFAWRWMTRRFRHARIMQKTIVPMNKFYNLSACKANSELTMQMLCAPAKHMSVKGSIPFLLLLSASHKEPNAAESPHVESWRKTRAWVLIQMGSSCSFRKSAMRLSVLAKSSREHSPIKHFFVNMSWLVNIVFRRGVPPIWTRLLKMVTISLGRGLISIAFITLSISEYSKALVNVARDANCYNCGEFLRTCWYNNARINFIYDASH